MSSILADVKNYLNRYGWATDPTVDPVELLQKLADEHEQMRKHNAKLVKQVQEATWSLRV
jgi:hypothetical protein